MFTLGACSCRQEAALQRSSAWAGICHMLPHVMTSRRGLNVGHAPHGKFVLFDGDISVCAPCTLLHGWERLQVEQWNN